MNIETNAETAKSPADGAVGVIFYIRSTDKFMFFLRDDIDSIPDPGMIDIIGGHVESGETPHETAMRELAEELRYRETQEPWLPEEITPFTQWIDENDNLMTIFGCVLEGEPDIYTVEGQGLVFLNRDELAKTEFAFRCGEIVLAYAATVQSSL